MSSLPKLSLIVSVYDKTGVTDFLHGLESVFSLDIVSTGGTAKLLEEAGFTVTPVSKLTQFPEMLSGRVKTLHPHILAGILADKSNPGHLHELAQHHIRTYDMVVVNLYPFADTIKDKAITVAQAREQIDIGGITLLRAAAKNSPHVTVISDPQDYQPLLSVVKKNHSIPKSYKQVLAQKAFTRTSHYDQVIASYLSTAR